MLARALPWAGRRLAERHVPLGETYGAAPLGLGLARALVMGTDQPQEKKGMEALLVSVGIVALAEIGDKTQLLALVLAARYRAPLPIIAGIFFATLLNHALAGALGAWLTRVLGPDVLRWALGISFVGMGLWTLIPDTLKHEGKPFERFGAFGATLVAFFLVEMGDKTQFATIALAAKYENLVAVVGGTTLGMLVANVPAVLLGDAAATKLPVRLIHVVAAIVFILLGALVLMDAQLY